MELLKTWASVKMIGVADDPLVYSILHRSSFKANEAKRMAQNIRPENIDASYNTLIDHLQFKHLQRIERYAPQPDSDDFQDSVSMLVTAWKDVYDRCIPLFNRFVAEL